MTVNFNLSNLTSASMLHIIKRESSLFQINPGVNTELQEGYDTGTVLLAAGRVIILSVE